MFKTVFTTDVRRTIAEAYAPGGAHIDKYLNVAGTGIENCVRDQVEALTKQPTFKMYRVEEDGQFVGYFGEEENGLWMSTIFIVEKYRPRKNEFWEVVKSNMRPTFMCGGFVKNEPACKFYRKMGGRQMDTFTNEAGPGFYFEFKKD